MDLDKLSNVGEKTGLKSENLLTACVMRGRRDVRWHTKNMRGPNDEHN